MAYTPIRLYQGQPGTSTTLLYTAAGNVIVKQILLANGDTVSRTVQIALGVAGAAIADGNIIVPDVSVPPKTLLTLDVSIVLANTDVLRGLQEDAAAIVVSIHGMSA